MLFLIYIRLKFEYNIPVLDKTLKGIRGVRPDNRKAVCAPGPRTKYFERIFYRSINYYIKDVLT